MEESDETKRKERKANKDLNKVLGETPGASKHLKITNTENPEQAYLDEYLKKKKNPFDIFKRKRKKED